MKKELVQKQMYEKQMAEIDEILASDTELEQYMNKIENTDTYVPSSLQHRILNGIAYASHGNMLPKEKKENIKEKEPVSEEGKVTSKPKVTKFDILKIAACTLFALIMWETTLSKPVSYASSNENIKKNEFYEKFDQTMKSISDFCMTRVHLEGGKK